MSKKILIVDDERANLKLFSRFLRALGYPDAQTLDNPTKVREVVQEEPPDLILLDLNMPGMDGFEVLRDLKASLKTLPPVIVLSAHLPEDVRESAVALGAAGFLGKPVTLEELKESLDISLNS